MPDVSMRNLKKLNVTVKRETDRFWKKYSFVYNKQLKYFRDYLSDVALYRQVDAGRIDNSWRHYGNAFAVKR